MHFSTWWASKKSLLLTIKHIDMYLLLLFSVRWDVGTCDRKSAGRRGADTFLICSARTRLCRSDVSASQSRLQLKSHVVRGKQSKWWAKSEHPVWRRETQALWWRRMTDIPQPLCDFCSTCDSDVVYRGHGAFLRQLHRSHLLKKKFCYIFAPKHVLSLLSIWLNPLLLVLFSKYVLN